MNTTRQLNGSPIPYYDELPGYQLCDRLRNLTAEDLFTVLAASS
jgi:hypothetical protein